MVRICLVDDEANVRSAAAKAFDALQDHLGVKAIDQTIPTLLEALRQPGASSGTALQALREVMAVSHVLALSRSHSHLDSGSRDDGIPRVDSHFDCNTYDCLQRSSTGFARDRRWQCFEQASDCHIGRFGESY